MDWIRRFLNRNPENTEPGYASELKDVIDNCESLTRYHERKVEVGRESLAKLTARQNLYKEDTDTEMRAFHNAKNGKDRAPNHKIMGHLKRAIKLNQMYKKLIPKIESLDMETLDHVDTAEDYKLYRHELEEMYNAVMQMDESFMTENEYTRLVKKITAVLNRPLPEMKEPSPQRVKERRKEMEVAMARPVDEAGAREINFEAEKQTEDFTELVRAIAPEYINEKKKTTEGEENEEEDQAEGLDEEKEGESPAPAPLKPKPPGE